MKVWSITGQSIIDISMTIRADTAEEALEKAKVEYNRDPIAYASDETPSFDTPWLEEDDGPQLVELAAPPAPEATEEK